MQEGEFLHQCLNLFARLLYYRITVPFNIFLASTSSPSKYSYIDIFLLIGLMTFLSLQERAFRISCLIHPLFAGRNDIKQRKAVIIHLITSHVSPPLPLFYPSLLPPPTPSVFSFVLLRPTSFSSSSSSFLLIFLSSPPPSIPSFEILSLFLFFSLLPSPLHAFFSSTLVLRASQSLPYLFLPPRSALPSFSASFRLLLPPFQSGLIRVSSLSIPYFPLFCSFFCLVLSHLLPISTIFLIVQVISSVSCTEAG